MLALVVAILISSADRVWLCGQWELSAIYDTQGKKHVDGLDRLLGDEPYPFRKLLIDFNKMTIGEGKGNTVVYGWAIDPLASPKSIDLLTTNPMKEIVFPGIYEITPQKKLKLKFNVGAGLKGRPYPRPKKFVGEEAGTLLILEYERAEK